MRAAGRTFLVAAEYINYEVKEWTEDPLTNQPLKPFFLFLYVKDSGKCIPHTHRFVNAFSAEAMQALHHCSCFPNNPCNSKELPVLHYLYQSKKPGTSFYATTTNISKWLHLHSANYKLCRILFLHEWQINMGKGNHFGLISCVLQVCMQ